MMKSVLFLALSIAPLTRVALFAIGTESETDDYWTSPEPFLHMSRVCAGLQRMRQTCDFDHGDAILT